MQFWINFAQAVQAAQCPWGTPRAWTEDLAKYTEVLAKQAQDVDDDPRYDNAVLYASLRDARAVLPSVRMFTDKKGSN